MSETSLPDEAPAWAVRLEAKVDVALADHGGEIRALKDWKRDAESRLRDVEQRKTVAPWQLWTAVLGAFGGIATMLQILDHLPA